MEKLKRKETIVVKTPESSCFEEAHFILRQGGPAGLESEMLKEATRILAAYEMRGQPEKKEKRRRSSLFYFIAGLLCGLACVIISGLFLVILS